MDEIPVYTTETLRGRFHVQFSPFKDDKRKNIPAGSEKEMQNRSSIWQVYL